LRTGEMGVFSKNILSSEKNWLNEGGPKGKTLR
jgi:hypothetical protein